MTRRLTQPFQYSRFTYNPWFGALPLWAQDKIAQRCLLRAVLRVVRALATRWPLLGDDRGQPPCVFWRLEHWMSQRRRAQMLLVTWL